VRKKNAGESDYYFLGIRNKGGQGLCKRFGQVTKWGKNGTLSRTVDVLPEDKIKGFA